MAQRKGWYGGAEKAETFYFEHDWVPVPGHPAEVATCDICGLNRWSDEHMSKAAERKPYGDVAYADPGYQKDRKRRYPIDTADHVRSAWSYINQAGNAAKYNPAQREKIKSRIAAAAKKLGVNLEREDAELRDRLRQRYGSAALAERGASLTKDMEDRIISRNRENPEAKRAHAFTAAKYPDAKGAPRCLVCGGGKDASAHGNVPVAAAATPTVASTYTINISGADMSSVLAGLHPTSSNPGVATITTIGGNGSTGSVTSAGPATVTAREAPPSAPAEESVKAFLTEVNGRTLLTAPANVFEVEKALHANKHFLWMQGRFVGAEKANRNGALWKTEDLELGQPTVRHGPLNWLHEARHVIGTIADTQLVTAQTADAGTDQPHISATSAIWRWIYPDEAWVIEQASDAGKLWYSMECVSEQVSCVGDGGCGATASYDDYVKGLAGCAHMQERSATRHFANPTFLGGAVIVPPVRPGWAEADARVMRQAASLAEHAFEQAGKPSVEASDWEQLMAQVLRFAGVS